VCLKNVTNSILGCFMSMLIYFFTFYLIYVPWAVSVIGDSHYSDTSFSRTAHLFTWQKGTYCIRYALFHTSFHGVRATFIIDLTFINQMLIMFILLAIVPYLEIFWRFRVSNSVKTWNSWNVFLRVRPPFSTIFFSFTDEIFYKNQQKSFSY
jgi:hypothetical protein